MSDENNNGSNGRKEVTVDRVDHLEVVNLHLKVIIAAQREAGLNQQIQEVQKERMELQQLILAKRAEIEEKYGIDLTTHDVREADGVVIPKGAQAMQMTKVLQQFQQGMPGIG